MFFCRFRIMLQIDLLQEEMKFMALKIVKAKIDKHLLLLLVTSYVSYQLFRSGRRNFYLGRLHTRVSLLILRMLYLYIEHRPVSLL